MKDRGGIVQFDNDKSDLDRERPRAGRPGVRRSARRELVLRRRAVVARGHRRAQPRAVEGARRGRDDPPAPAVQGSRSRQGGRHAVARRGVRAARDRVLRLEAQLERRPAAPNKSTGARSSHGSTVNSDARGGVARGGRVRQGPTSPPAHRRRAPTAPRSTPAQAATTEAFCDRPRDRRQGGRRFAGPSSPPAARRRRAPTTWRWVNVWATWCKPCVEEMPRLAAGATSSPRPASASSSRSSRSTTPTPRSPRFARSHPDAPPSLRIANADKRAAWLKSFGLDDGAIPIHLFVSPGQPAALRPRRRDPRQGLRRDRAAARRVSSRRPSESRSASHDGAAARARSLRRSRPGAVTGIAAQAVASLCPPAPGARLAR